MSTHVQGCRQGGAGGSEAPPVFKLMLQCVRAVTAKGRPKFIIIGKQEENRLSGYKQSYTYKNQSLKVSTY